MHCNGAATNGKLHEAHEELEATEKALDEAFASQSKDMAAIVQTAFAAFESANEAHLKHEEQVMMPKVQELVKKGHPMKKYMVQELLPAVTADDMEFFIKYAATKLEAASISGSMPRFRVFCHALWAVARPGEWKIWDAWIRDSVSVETYHELEKALS